MTEKPDIGDDKEKIMFTCGNCGIKQSNMESCSNCHSIAYCSTRCQEISKTKHAPYCENKTKPFRNLGTVCKFCGKIADDFQEKRECPGCYHTVYCSRTCLAKDWENHKQTCLNMVTPMEACAVCDSTENLKACSKCKSKKYCSRKCQKLDWRLHKPNCKDHAMMRKIKVEEKLREMRMLEIRYLNKIQRSRQQYIRQRPDDDFSVNLFDDFADVTIFKRPTRELWNKSVSFAKKKFPYYEIVTSFQLVSSEESTMHKSKPLLLVAFIPRYHHYRGRHCVYLEDETESEMYAAFYFNRKDFPVYNWSDIRPGRFVIINSPKIHTFRDHTIGFRFDNPAKLTFIDP